jgi:hypothetical protein
MASKEHKIIKPGAAGTTMDITLTITDILEIIREPGTPTSHSMIMTAYKTGFLNIWGVKKHMKKTASKNLGQ